MAFISEVSEKIYEIKPKGKELENFPLCTVYLIVDDKAALVEVGCPVQLPDVLDAVGKLGFDIKKLSYIIPTHVHPDHAGGAGLLARQLPQAKVVAHLRAAKVLSDRSILERLMQGFIRVYGDDALERFGAMVPIAEDKFVLVEDGQSISLGQRELKIIHTPGHDPNHLCFLDTKSGGLFCGDAFGGYFSEVEVSIPSSAPGSDPIITLQSIDKCHELNPAILFFSHGGTASEATRMMQMLADNNRKCVDIALEALKAGKDIEEIANSLADILVKGSKLSREDLAASPYFITATVEGYRQYFNRNMI
ncbi:MAG: MBL fold metallo-hydrolase [Desulfobacterales bacterium]|jgi:glyoxylase-like metal-dependent hydrolase (beta-lactamase superfamily II)